MMMMMMMMVRGGRSSRSRVRSATLTRITLTGSDERSNTCFKVWVQVESVLKFSDRDKWGKIEVKDFPLL